MSKILVHRDGGAFFKGKSGMVGGKGVGGSSVTSGAGASL